MKIRLFCVSAIGLFLAATIGLLAIHRPIEAASRMTTAPNVIVVVVDALRADHVSAYGYTRPTTPHLDTQIANPGARFDAATAAAAWTYPANAAMLSGYLPSHLSVAWSQPASRVPTDTVMLAERLKEAGYYTAGFVTAYYALDHFGFAQGFDVYSQHVRANSNSTRAEEINQIAMNWIDTQWVPVLSATQPLFLYLYYYDPHTWYTPPAPYDTLYDATYTGTLTSTTYADGENVVNGTLVPTSRDVEHLQALYDGEITYWDAQFGLMLDFLASRHMLDNSLIIVTSDHGEMFGEHGKWTHRNSLYEEVLRVPLLVRYTGIITPGLVITSPVQTTDVTPSVLDWLNLPVPFGLDGQSLRPLTENSIITSTRDIFSEMDAITDPAVPGYWLAPRYELRSLRRGDWKYIHPIGLRGQDELYMLQANSPYETTNVIASEPAVAHELFQAMIDYLHLLTRFTLTPVIAR